MRKTLLMRRDKRSMPADLNVAGQDDEIHSLDIYCRVIVSVQFRFRRITLSLESASQGTSPAYKSLSSDLTHVSSSLPSSLLSPSITPSLSRSRLETRLFHTSFPPQLFYLSTRHTDFMDSCCFSFLSAMLIVTLALCARLSWLPVSFQVHTNHCTSSSLS